MKKLSLLWALLLVVFVAGCSWWWNKEKEVEEIELKTDITDVKFDIESCNKYFQVIDCTLDNDNNSSYTEEERQTLREEIGFTQEVWSQLDDESLAKLCDDKLGKLKLHSEEFSKIGCSLD